ncbi:MAG: phage major capsid protein [Thaumarchaeota archaeon]|nr:MAG: phage major capsid protein [Nitrososphaerota archaeon]
MLKEVKRKMAEMKYIKELLGTGLGTEGQLLIPRKIHDALIEEVDKNLIPRSEAALYFGPADIPGSSIDVDLVTPNKMDVRVVAEGAEIPLDQTEYTSTNLKPVKYGVAIRITRELLEDAKWNLLEHNIKIAGKRFAENENSLIISNALDDAGNTVSGGASITIANITSAMQNLEDNDYTPTTLIVGMEVLNDLRNIDTFVEANKVGNTEMLQRGFLGTIYGMNVIKVSSNAGMTSTTAYVIDKNHAYMIAEKRPVTIENFELPTYDMSAAAITQRIVVEELRANAIAKITTS